MRFLTHCSKPANFPADIVWLCVDIQSAVLDGICCVFWGFVVASDSLEHKLSYLEQVSVKCQTLSEYKIVRQKITVPSIGRTRNMQAEIKDG